MKTLILPAEIRSREMDARLLHAALAVVRGWRVIVGSKAHINRVIWKMPRGVYLFTTLTAKRATMARLLAGMGFVSQGWDEEGLVYRDSELYLARRISLETARHVNQIFAWGKVGAQDVESKLSAIGKRVVPIGNPRFDLLRPELQRLYAAQAEEIRRRHGPFILVNTNFSSVNPAISRQDFPLRAVPEEARRADRKVIGKYNDFLEYRTRMFAMFREALPVLSRAFPRMNVVLRPHPVENMEPWRELSRDLPNLRVEREGASIPWLMAADALVHNGCTTGVEMRLLGGEPVAYEPIPNTADSKLPNGVSHKARSADELVAVLREVMAGERGIAEEQEQMLRAYVVADGKLAAQRALDHAEELLEEMGEAPPTAPFARARAVLRHAVKSWRPNNRTDRYLARVFPETPMEWVSARLERISDIVGADIGGAKVKKIAFNVFVIERDGQPVSR